MGNYLTVGETYATRDNQFTVSGVEKKEDKTHGKEQKGIQGNSIYVGNLFKQQDTLSQKFAMRQKDAVKRVLDQFRQDLETDEEMRELNEHADSLVDDIRLATEQIKGVDERREEIRQRYEVAPDSQEQKDLELMQKANAAKEHPFDEKYQLTEEEERRLAEMPPMTAYQQEMIECDEEEKMYRKNRNDAQIDVVVDRATVHATKKALLKVHPMVDARKEAEKMMESALEDLAVGLLQEGVENIDEKMQETEEEMLENQEEALEKKIEQEKLKEEEAAQEETEQEVQSIVLSAEMQAVSGTQRAVQNLQSNVKSLIQEQVMLEVDLKGLRMNQQI